MKNFCLVKTMIMIHLVEGRVLSSHLSGFKNFQKVNNISLVKNTAVPVSVVHKDARMGSKVLMMTVRCGDAL